MSACCSPSQGSPAHPHKRLCPRNGVACAEVAPRTIAHHIKNAWEWNGKSQRYYFCADPGCDVVYFGDDDSVILKSQLRTVVGIKDAASDALLCYCFGVTQAGALRDAKAREYVLEQTKLGMCACETRNPSGRCCLKDFPRSSKSG